MAKPYRVLVFGKAGCDKCRALNKRLVEILDREEWADFDKRDVDVETADGLLAFCRAECLNPQRIPGFVVLRRQGGDGEYGLLERAAPGTADPACGTAALYHLYGLQTDYSEAGRGVLSPRMILAALTEARGAGDPRDGAA